MFLLQFASLVIAGFFSALQFPLEPELHPMSASPGRVLIRFGGDCLFSEHYESEVAGDVERAFASTALFSEADIAMVNLEGPITGRGTPREKPYTFRMKPWATKALLAGGIDIVNLANNHLSDFGPDGIWDTMDQLELAGIKYVGAGRTAREAYKPVVITKNGRTIAFMGYYAGNEAIFAGENSPGVALRDLGIITRTIASLRKAGGVDDIIVSLHWGEENALVPEAGQRDFARALADAGATAVIGHHSHVWQSVERYKNCIIAYSLGNLVFGGNGKSSYQTGVLELTLDSTSTWRYIPARVVNWALEGPEDVQAAPLVAALVPWE